MRELCVTVDPCDVTYVASGTWVPRMPAGNDAHVGTRARSTNGAHSRSGAHAVNGAPAGYADDPHVGTSALDSAPAGYRGSR